MEKPYKATGDIYVIPSHAPVPGLGLLSINAFVIKGKEPVLVDTGMPIDREEFLKALWSLVDPQNLRWVVMTHEDIDHAGNLQEILEAAPNARLVTNFIGVGKLTAVWEVPLPRVYLLNHGQSLDVGDRKLTALRPPVFDAPETSAIFDSKENTLFSADSFGAFIPTYTEDAADIPEADFMRGFNIWNQANHPWTWMVDRSKFEQGVEAVLKLRPDTILSAHLPAAHGHAESFAEWMKGIPDLEPFVFPDQAALEAMLSNMPNMQGGGPPS